MTPNKQFILKLLDINLPMENIPYRLSTISLLLRSARKLSGRDLVTGIYEGREFNEQNFVDETYNSFLFTSLLNYLILLDQIGIIFGETSNSNGIVSALDTFSKLPKRKKTIIKELRNSLAHNFGLTSNKYICSFSRKKSRYSKTSIKSLEVW